MYLMGYVTLLLAGPGRFSVDKALFGRSGGTGCAKKNRNWQTCRAVARRAAF
jgi:hypothetical protein